LKFPELELGVREFLERSIKCHQYMQSLNFPNYGNTGKYNSSPGKFVRTARKFLVFSG
jgi:hypothetical protein